MEAARLPMICFQPKICTEKTEFTPVLISLISSHFEEDGNSYSKECQELDQLRVTVCNAPMDYTACNTLKKYYCQLCFLVNRFPFLADQHISGLKFIWEDQYIGDSHRHNEIDFEKAAVLYNIGAIHSYLGSSDNRSTPEGMKVSCTHFQYAAWAFQHLRDNFKSTYCSDWTNEILSFQEQLMLAQSQECILEKSMADNRKASITAKVAVQCSEFYKKALSYLESSRAASVFSSSSVKAEEQNKYGERVAYAQAAVDHLAEVTKISQGMDDELKTSVQFINDVVSGKHNAAKKENNFVYHEKVPALDTLPEIKGAVLVKGLGFDVSDKSISGPDIFSKLVPMEAHEASSLYSEEKAKLLREVGSRIEDHDTKLGQYLASLQIDPDKLLPEFDHVPDILVEKCAAISIRPETMIELRNAMEALSEISEDVTSGIQKIEETIQEETTQENEFQEKYGKRRVPVMFEDLAAETEKCKQALAKASHSNNELHKAMNLHVRNLNILALPLDELKTALPNPNTALTEEESEIISRIKQLFAKITEMKNQRTEFYKEFRDNVLADDITKKIVTRGSDDTNAFFYEQLKKHDSLKEAIEMNLSAQGRILEALTQANVKFVPARQKIDLALHQRTAMIDSLVYSYDVYKDLLEKQQKGIEFYQKLKHNVQRLLERAEGLCKTQTEDRALLESKLKPKGPPPSRPTASKPGVNQLESKRPNVRPASSGPPKLKDYLPFMKNGGNAAEAISSVTDDNLDIDDMDDLDLDDVQLPDLKGNDAPKLKDFLPLMKNKQQTSQGGLGLPPDLSDLPPDVLKYMPKNLSSGFLPSPSLRLPAPVSLNPRGLLPAHNPNQRPPVGIPGTSAHSNVPSHQTYHLPAGIQPANMATPNPHVRPPNPAVSQMNRFPIQPGPNVPRPTLPTASIHGFDQLHSMATPASTNRNPTSAPTLHDPALPSNIPINAQSASIPAAPSAHPFSLGHAMPSLTSSSITNAPTQYSAGFQPLALQNPGIQPFPAHSQSHSTATHPQKIQAPSLQSVPQQDQTAQNMPHLPHMGQPFSANRMPMHGRPMGPHSMQNMPAHTFPTSSNLPVGNTSGITPVNVSAAQHQPVTSAAIGQPLQPSHSGIIPVRPAYAMPSSASQMLPSNHPMHQQQLNPGRLPFNPASPNMPSHPMQQSQPLPQTSRGFPIGSNQSFIPPFEDFDKASKRHEFGGEFTSSISQSPTSLGTTGQYHPLSAQSNSNVPHQSPGFTLNGNSVNQPSNQYPVVSQQPNQPRMVSQQPNQPQMVSQQPNQPRMVSQQPNQPQMVSQQPNQPRMVSQQPNQFPTVSQQQSQPPIISQQPGQPRMVSQQPTQFPMVSQQQNQPPIVSQQQSQPPIMSQQPGQSQMVLQQSTQTQIGTNQPNQSQMISQQPMNVQSSNAPHTMQYSHHQTPHSLLGQNDPRSVMVPHTTRDSQHNPLQSGAHVPSPLPSSGTAVPPIGNPNRVNTSFTQYGQVSSVPQIPGQSPATVQTVKPTVTGQHRNRRASDDLLSGGIQSNGHVPLQPFNSGTPQNSGRVSPASSITSDGSRIQTLPNPSSSAAQQPANTTIQGQPMQSQAQSSNDGVRNWLLTQSGVQAGNGNKPVQSVSPQRKVVSHIEDMAGVTIMPSVPRIDANFESKIDWSLATDPPQLKAEQPGQGQTHSQIGVPKITLESTAISRQNSKDLREPYSDDSSLQQFVSSVERYIKQVESLNKPSLLGPTPLDKEWQDLNEEQDREVKRNSMAAGMSESTRNRYHDILPYDKYRVSLSGGKNDYINASIIENLPAGCPRIVATQGPLNQTELDFWNLILQERIEIIVMLSRWSEQDHSETVRYWPRDRNDRLNFGDLLITLQLTNNHKYWIERRITMTNLQTKDTHTCIQLQFTGWSATQLPDSMSLLLYINEVTALYKKQRRSQIPLVVHCGNGISKTGVFCVLFAGVSSINSGQGFINVHQIVMRLRQRRKGMVSTKQEYLYCHTTLLYYAQDILVKRGILTSQASFSNPLPVPGTKTHGRTPSNDFIMSDTSLALLGELSSLELKSSPKAEQEESKVNSNQQTAVATSIPTDNSQHPSQDISQPVIQTQIIGDQNTSNIDGPAVKEAVDKPPVTSTQQLAETSQSSSQIVKLQDPSTFDIGKGRQRISKADFFNPNTGIAKTTNTNADDPFSALDPMWSLTNK